MDMKTGIFDIYMRYSDFALPIGFEIAQRDILFCDLKTRKKERQSSVSKHAEDSSFFGTKILINTVPHMHNDWIFGEVHMDYEKITITISNKPARLKIECKNFIGFQWLGQWDENVIENISIMDAGSVIDECKKRVLQLYSRAPTLGNGSKRLQDNWCQLNIKLIDGVLLIIVYREIDVISATF